MPLRIHGLILKTQDMEKESQANQKSSHMKSGINGQTAYTTNSRQEKKSGCAPILFNQKGYIKPRRH